MNIKAIIVPSIAIALLLSGCAVTKTLIATGGSKSDGIIEMSFEYGGFEKPEINWAQE